MKKSLLITILMMSFSISQAAELLPFTSDGCSSSPDGLTANDEFLECCVNHDLLYWKGGTHDEKKAADTAFKSCMDKKAISPISWLYYTSVRIGGNRNLKASWAWGYGWSPLRPYKALSSEEQSLVKQMTPDLSLTLPLIKTFPLSPLTISNIKAHIIEKYNFDPKTIGQVYRFVQMIEGQANYVNDYTERNYYLVTRADCPQGYYIIDATQLDKADKNETELRAFGTCPKL